MSKIGFGNFSPFCLSPSFTHTEDDAYYYQELSFEENHRRGEKTGLKYTGVTSKRKRIMLSFKIEVTSA